jgi:hypothetical protein
MNDLWTFISKDTRARRITLVVVLLALENLWFLSGHYRGTLRFPYDFAVTYHSVPFYWQGVARAGEFPHWIPYQAYGYPMSLNLQSGLFYPPLWFFPASGVTYSLHAAAILESLHFLVGGLGAFAFARARRMSFTTALIAAFAYQAFGGFFCNAQHVDIARGYAILPWLLAALTLEDDGSIGWSRAWWVVPAVFFLMTGVYPGQAFPCLAFSFGYLAVQIAEARINRRAVAAAVRAAAVRAFAIVFGLALTAVSLLPIALQRGEIDRVEDTSKLTRLYAGLNHFLTTLFPYHTPQIEGDLSMRSFFITIPVLFGVFLLRRQSLRQHCSLLFVSLAAVAMVASSTIFELVARFVPMLGVSRFPIADYRALVALPVLLLGAHAIGELFERRIASRSLILSIALFVLLVVMGGHRLHWFAFNWRFVFVIAAVIGLALATLVRRIPSWLLVTSVIPLMLFDSNRMHFADTQMWRQPLEHKPYKRYAKELVAAIRTKNVERPARVPATFQGQAQRGFPVLDGYLRGVYNNDDYSASEHLRAVVALRASPELSAYLMRASEPKVVAASTPDAMAALAATTIGSATTRRYAAEKVRYQVSTPVDGVLIENEPSFPGWHAYLDCAHAKELSPLPAYWPLRAWRLPQGEHKVCLRYSTPGFRAALAISLACLALWIAAGAWLLWRRRVTRLATR